jgi:hypothetical protein
MQFFYATERSFNMKLTINIDISPEEIKQLLKMAKKLGAVEILQTALSAATPAPADEPELPIGTFSGGEEIPAQEPTSVPAPKRGRKPKATLGFR